MSGVVSGPTYPADILAEALGLDWQPADGAWIGPKGRVVPVRDGIARFREDDGYNASFALQWATFRTTQYDEVNGTDLSGQRFAETGWNVADMAGKLILEAGCGAGRFTPFMARAGGRLVSFDYSEAVDVNRANNASKGTIAFAQCDLLDLPFKPGGFDLVFCHGVLQHTANPRQAFAALVRMLKPGGRISVDIYRKDGLIRPWKSKYLWRWLTTRVAPEKLLRFLQWFIPKWLPIDTAIKSIPYAGNYLGSIIPCWNYMNRPLSKQYKIQWAIMDTFDALAPTYDLPATLEDMQEWAKAERLTDIDVHPGGNGVVLNGRKPG